MLYFRLCASQLPFIMAAPKAVVFYPNLFVAPQSTMFVAALVVLFLGAPVHRTGPVDHEHNLQRLLLDGGVADVGLYGDLPLGVTHPLGGLAQGDAVVVWVSDGLGLEGVVLLAIGGEGADLDQAEGHDHSHEHGQSSAAKALERIRSFLQSFVSHYFVLLLIFCNRNGILAAGLAWRNALAPIALRPALSGGLPWSVSFSGPSGPGSPGNFAGVSCSFPSGWRSLGRCPAGGAVLTRCGIAVRCRPPARPQSPASWRSAGR